MNELLASVNVREEGWRAIENWQQFPTAAQFYTDLYATSLTQKLARSYQQREIRLTVRSVSKGSWKIRIN